MTDVADVHGARIPLLGLGTWELRGRSCARLVEQAIRFGYRHIDTAQMYGNEAEVGEGVRNSGKRHEVLVVTKLQPTNLLPREVDHSAKESLAKLRLDAIDLLLIHWPNPRVPVSETLGAMARLRELGVVRHIGVSNFTTKLLDDAVKAAPAPIVCDQFEMHPYLDQSKLVAACKLRGLLPVAYSPIARGHAKGDEVLSRIGKAHGKTAAQVSLRYLVQQGVAVIPRTSKVERLEENAAIFDFMLSADEMKAIAGLARGDGRIVDWSWSPDWDK
ncbi:MAG TPA: aldo/keto reductase [Pseudolabrys sp.]|nr:aldo/keto reductase [Pseudolabrys sp.]